LLVDEILIGQDAGNAAFLLELLWEQAEGGNAVILVNHAPEVTQRFASRLLFFEGGQVVVDAPTDEGLERLDSLGYGAYLPSGARTGGQP
jgi:ABC-type multidrug transport system ATPase subunit